MSGSPGDDALLQRVGIEWLNQYARFLRRTPDFASRLAAESEAFDLVPIPKKLLDQLADPGLIGSRTCASVSMSAAFAPRSAYARYRLRYRRKNSGVRLNASKAASASLSASGAAAASALAAPRNLYELVDWIVSVLTRISG